jgi:cysteine desulfurase
MINDLTDRGYTIIIIPVTKDGTINMKLYEKLVIENKDKIVLVSCMLVNNEIGTIQPINEMIQFLKNECSDAIFHSDVGGSIGLFHKLYNDFVIVPDIITCSCYKFHGPHYGLLISNCIMRHEYYGTPDVRNICEIQMALSDYISKYNILEINNNIIKNILITTLSTIFDMNGIAYKFLNNKPTVNNIVSFILPALKASFIQQKLSDKNIYIGSGSACTTNSGSHTLKAMGYSDEISQKLIRLSYNSNDFNKDDYSYIVALIGDSIVNIIKSHEFLVSTIDKSTIIQSVPQKKNNQIICTYCSYI